MTGRERAGATARARSGAAAAAIAASEAGRKHDEMMADKASPRNEFDAMSGVNVGRMDNSEFQRRPVSASRARDAPLPTEANRVGDQKCVPEKAVLCV